MVWYKKPNWGDTGLLQGLSERQKSLCCIAFDQGFDLVFNNDIHGIDNKIAFNSKEKYSNEIKGGMITIPQLMMLFKRKGRVNFEIDLSVVLFPLIRRLVGLNKDVDVKRLFRHCRTNISKFDPTKFGANHDIEAECCAFLADTY
jgi:hypothetical protein